jgi:hypothetical protein
VGFPFISIMQQQQYSVALATDQRQIMCSIARRVLSCCCAGRSHERNRTDHQMQTIPEGAGRVKKNHVLLADLFACLPCWMLLLPYTY